MTIGFQKKNTNEKQSVKIICAKCHSLTICLIITPISDIAKSDFQNIMHWHLAYGRFNLYSMRRND